MRHHKLLCIISAMLIACTGTVGCGNEKEENKKKKPLDKEDPVTITVWHYYNGVQQTSFDEIVKEFNDTVGFEEGIIVEAYSKSSIDELSQSVVAAVNGDAGADTPPNIFATYSETAYTLDLDGKLADLKQYLTDDEIGEYIDEYIDEGMFDGETLKIFPTAKSTEIMMINKTDWDKFSQSEGVSLDDISTIEGLVEVSEKYYNYTDALTPDIPNDGKAFYGRDSAANYMYIGARQLGCQYVDINEDGKASLNVDKGVVRKLWDNYYVPYVKGYFTAQSRFRSDDAKTGSLIALVCSTTGAAYFPDEVTLNDDYTYPIENIITKVPVFEGTEPYLVQQGAGMSVIKSDEKTEYACLEFLKWFTEEERNIEFSVGSGYLPVKKAANDFEAIKKTNENLEQPMDDTMLNAINIAIEEINERALYTSAPFSKSAEMRDYIGDTIQSTASADHETVMQRISGGEDRDAVLEDFISDEAFDKWYDSFVSSLEGIINS